jgi:hypothetical protein
LMCNRLQTKYLPIFPLSVTFAAIFNLQS